jgi:glucokinase
MNEQRTTGGVASVRFGMDYGGTNVKAGVFTDGGETVMFREIPLLEITEAGNLLEGILNHALDVAKGHPITAGGFACKGLVDVGRGVVLEDIGAGSLLAGVKLRESFSEALGVPFALENDARAYALGEWRFGAGNGARAMVCLTLGTGVGCSAVVDGRPYQGADQLGGLLGGHISIDRNGPACPCGNRGCLELYCSATALHARVRLVDPELGRSGVDPLAEFFGRAGDGDARYLPPFRKIIDDLAIGIVNVIHAYGPDVVVVGGGVMRSAKVILPPLTEAVQRMAWTVPRNTVKIRAATLGNKAAALGVAFHPSLS